MNPAKSIFRSSTFWGVLLLFTQHTGYLVADSLEDGRLDSREGVELIIGFLTAMSAIVGRVNASSPVYTPRGLPGPNQSDFEEEWNPLEPIER